MKIVFFGTPEFAVASLDILVKSGYAVSAVVTAPDKPAGRGMAITQSAVKRYAISQNLRVMQPLSLKDESFLSGLRALGADLFIVVAFRFLPEQVWTMPPLGTFNLHASLLPQYRGAAPINRAIMNGEKETGLTTFFLQKEIDTGKMIFREKVSIGENETAGELHDRMMGIGAELVLKTVRAIEMGKAPQADQSEYVNSEEELKKAPKIFKEDCRINWSDTVDAVYNLVRGLSPYPAAFTEFQAEDGNVQSIKIFRAGKKTGKHSMAPGSIASDGKTYIQIAAADGFIELHEVQQAGKKRMKAEEFLRGFRVSNYPYAK